MMDQTTQEYLTKLFGEKVGPAPAGTEYQIYYQPEIMPTESAIVETLRASGLFTNHSVHRMAHGYNIIVPYADVLAARESTTQDPNNKTLIGRLLCIQQPDNTHILVPIPKNLDSRQCADHLSKDFGFAPALSISDNHLVLSLAQYQTLRNEWQKHAKTTGADELAARIRDERLGQPLGPKGTPLKKENPVDDALSMMIEQGSAGILGMFGEETSAEDLRRILGIGDVMTPEEYEASKAPKPNSPSDTPPTPDTRVHSTKINGHTVEREDGSSVVRVNFGKR